MVACLQAILNKHNIILEQKEIAKKIGCTEEGVLDLDYIKNFMGGLGFKFDYFHWNEIPNDARETFLETKKDVIVAIPNKNNGKHVLLLEKFKDPTLYVMDPNDIFIYKFDLFELTSFMRNKNIGGFGLVEKLDISPKFCNI